MMLLAATAAQTLQPILTIHDDFVRRGYYHWMLWNGALAFIPALLVLVLFRREDQPRRGIRTVTFFVEFGLVMLILPNAPYAATDLIHFLESVRLNGGSLWAELGKEFPLYVAYVLFCLACYGFVVDRLLYAIDQRLGRSWRYAAILVIPLLSAIGVYIGRVARFNSWDIVSEPAAILESSTNAFDSIRVVKVVLAMTGLLVVLHQVYQIFHDGLRFRIGHIRGLLAERRSGGEATSASETHGNRAAPPEH